MGRHAQKRIIRKLDLELFLTKIESQPAPKADLEQYTISESAAAAILYVAAYANNDIVGKTVLDLGCGTGRLALGAAYLGAREVVGVDVDKRAIKTALENSSKVDLEGGVQWVVGDIAAIRGSFGTVLQNPPFGVQTRAADRAFLVKALELGKSIYSLHNHPKMDKGLIKKIKNGGGLAQVQSSPFMERFVSEHGGTIKGAYAMVMSMPRLFDFHTRLRHDLVVDLYILAH